MSIGLQTIIGVSLALSTAAIVTVAAAANAALNAKANELTSRSAQILKHAGLLLDDDGRPVK